MKIALAIALMLAAFLAFIRMYDRMSAKEQWAVWLGYFFALAIGLPLMLLTGCKPKDTPREPSMVVVMHSPSADAVVVDTCPPGKMCNPDTGIPFGDWSNEPQHWSTDPQTEWLEKHKPHPNFAQNSPISFDTRPFPSTRCNCIDYADCWALHDREQAILRKHHKRKIVGSDSGTYTETGAPYTTGSYSNLDFSAAISMVGGPHGCGWSFAYDEKSNTCQLNIEVHAEHDGLSCETSVIDSQAVNIICSYPAKESPK